MATAELARASRDPKYVLSQLGARRGYKAAGGNLFEAVLRGALKAISGA
jgi:hypothetical protein